MTTWFVGSYTADMAGDSAGIVALEARPDGSLEVLGLAAVADSPSYLVAHEGMLYAAAEGTGTIEAFRRGPGFTLEHVASAPSGGSFPCHLSVLDRTHGPAVVAASCYGDGVVGVLDTDPLALSAILAGAGDGPHAAQDGPHAHATFRLDEDTVLSADLGADRVHIHSFNDGVLTRTGSLVLPAGTGPRDFARHPSGRILLLGELSLEVLVLEWMSGELTPVSSAALPGGVAGDHAAGLALSEDGTRLYVGLRGSNVISVLGIDADGRNIFGIDSVSGEGDWPRHVILDGDVLHVVHQRSGTIASFNTSASGLPELIREPTAVASPTLLCKG